MTSPVVVPLARRIPRDRRFRRSFRSAHRSAKLDVQRVLADGASRWMRSNVTKVKDKHVRGPANDGQSKTNQDIECIRLHPDEVPL